MSLFTQRQAAREEAAARARGENVDGLTDLVPPEFRQQLIYAIDEATTWRELGQGWQVGHQQKYLKQQIRQHLREEYGKAHLAVATDNDHEDLGRFILDVASAHQVMDVIDAVFKILSDEAKNPRFATYTNDIALRFSDTVSKRMMQHKLAFAIVELNVVEKRSEELHEEVVAAGLTLLHGRLRFSEAERQYRDALDELAAGNWADAVTDASATVENVLRTILGMTQGALADLLGQARIRGLFGETQSARLKKVVAGFTALADMRNEESDAHGNNTDAETAWLAVHWAGALVVYLVQRAEAKHL